MRWIVLGENHEKLQQRLLSEPDLTFDKSLQIARMMEAAEKDTQQLKSQQNTVLFVDKEFPRDMVDGLISTKCCTTTA